MRRADRWAQGLLLVLLGLVLGTSAVLLVGPRPCPDRDDAAPPLLELPETSVDGAGELNLDETSASTPGESVADDSWGSLGP